MSTPKRKRAKPKAPKQTLMVVGCGRRLMIGGYFCGERTYDGRTLACADCAAGRSPQLAPGGLLFSVGK
jgi:ribosomal protein L37E